MTDYEKLRQENVINFARPVFSRLNFKAIEKMNKQLKVSFQTEELKNLNTCDSCQKSMYWYQTYFKNQSVNFFLIFEGPNFFLNTQSLLSDQNH